MSAAWVAACVRGRQLVLRAAGGEATREIAGAPSWAAGRAVLAETIYGESLPEDADRAAAKRHAFEVAAWELRVLSGWLPPAAASLARLAAAPIEIANVERHLRGLADPGAGDLIDLGSLGGVSRRLAATGSSEQVRALLARSVWGDPGDDDPLSIAFGMRVAWARRAARQSKLARGWARAGGAVLVARERLLLGREISVETMRDLDGLLGPRWREAADLAALRTALPTSSRWVFAEIERPDELWRAELAVVGRVAVDAAAAMASTRYDAEVLTAILAILLVDLWRVTAAIEAAGSGLPVALEVLDVVAS